MPTHPTTATVTTHSDADAERFARAKILRRPSVVDGNPLVVPARMLNEVVYCERLAYLEWVQGEFEDNAFTVDGRAVHATVDQGGTTTKKKRRKKAAGETDAKQADESVVQTRSVWLTSERLGITAKIDLVEEGPDGKVAPVEHKRGHRPDIDQGAHLPERVQLAAQALLLREHGYVCDQGWIYFAADRLRVPIAITDELISHTLRAATRLRELAAAATIPPPLQNDPRCDGCSLAGVCLPDELDLLRRIEQPDVFDERSEPEPPLEPLVFEGPLERDPWGLVGDVLPISEPRESVRRLLPAREERLPLYIRAQGAKLTLDGEELVAQTREGLVHARLPATSQVCVFGNVQVTTPALRALFERGIPLFFFSYGGWFLGRTAGPEPKNVELRLAQYRSAMDDAASLGLARGFVASKILNCRTLLRRNHANAPESVLFELKQLARKVESATSIESLLGLEGTAARVYFGAFTGMLTANTEPPFELEGRNRRPPRDPVNALLSLAYALLTKDFTLAVTAAGLDPMLGYLHQPRFGKPALALDLMEEFRPIVADSVVLGAINNGVVTPEDFVTTVAGCALSDGARRKFLLAYERRMDQLVTHPVFGYRISYRRVLAVQARLLGRRLLGELDTYPAFRTR